MEGGSNVLSHIEFDNEKKVNKPVLSAGMVPVKLSGGRWVITTQDDHSWYDYSTDENTWANVMLKDDLTVLGVSKEELQKASLTDLVGKEVEIEGSSYVWVPRYTTTSIGETGSKIIFSNLTSDTKELNGEVYTLPESFTYGTGSDKIDLTGIWVRKNEAGFQM